MLQVKGLAFNQLSPNLLASGGADGDIIIWDVANPKKPTAFPPLKASLTCCVSVLAAMCDTVWQTNRTVLAPMCETVGRIHSTAQLPGSSFRHACTIDEFKTTFRA